MTGDHGKAALDAHPAILAGVTGLPDPGDHLPFDAIAAAGKTANALLLEQGSPEIAYVAIEKVVVEHHDARRAGIALRHDGCVVAIHYPFVIQDCHVMQGVELSLVAGYPIGIWQMTELVEMNRHYVQLAGNCLGQRGLS